MFSVNVSHAHHTPFKGKSIAILGEYSGTIKMERNLYLVRMDNPDSSFKVKGIMSLEFTNKELLDKMNPWILVESKSLQPDYFIGKAFKSCIVSEID